GVVRVDPLLVRQVVPLVTQRLTYGGQEAGLLDNGPAVQVEYLHITFDQGKPRLDLIQRPTALPGPLGKWCRTVSARVSRWGWGKVRIVRHNRIGQTSSADGRLIRRRSQQLLADHIQPKLHMQVIPINTTGCLHAAFSGICGNTAVIPSSRLRASAATRPGLVPSALGSSSPTIIKRDSGYWRAMAAATLAILPISTHIGRAHV